jgi:hypothetical protein
MISPLSNLCLGEYTAVHLEALFRSFSDNILDARQPKMILLTICLCLGSLVLCEVIDPITTWDDSRHMSEQGGVPHQSHVDEHEDDFVLTEQAAAHTRAASTLENRSAHLLGVSLSPSPLLPPPKAA